VRPTLTVQETSPVKWLLVCDPDMPVEEYGERLPGVPSWEEIAGCPAGYKALYLEASIEQVRPLASGDARVCRLRPVWEKPSFSPAELLVLGRRLEMLHEAESNRGNDEPEEREGPRR
jgi:hypothetical protein